MSNNENHTILFQKMLKGECTPQERQAIINWLGDDDSQAQSEAIIGEYFNSPVDAAHIDAKILNNLQARLNVILSEDAPQKVVAPVQSLRTANVRQFMTRWAGVAAIIISVATGAYLWNNEKENEEITASAEASKAKLDIAPGSTRAMLTLSDGRKIELTPETGEISESGITIRNSHGQLSYSSPSSLEKRGTAAASGKPTLNTMSTPRGGQYQLTLPDGTRVWLNAASSITYSTVFSGNNRPVSISGEVYFEVAKDKSKPFLVKTPTGTITVLGTHFNVNAYPDEPMKTSLLEGAVEVSGKILKPGQAYLNGKIIKTDLDQDIAWKNGDFNFEGAELTAVMRQISRWYDIQVSYRGNIKPKRFFGTISRDISLINLLEGLKRTGVKYELKEKELVITE